MARTFRRIPAITDLRQAEGNDADVTVEPASETTEDAPELTDSDVAPEASPAQTKSKGSRSGKSKRKAASK